MLHQFQKSFLKYLNLEFLVYFNFKIIYTSIKYCIKYKYRIKYCIKKYYTKRDREREREREREIFKFHLMLVRAFLCLKYMKQNLELLS